MGSSKNNGKPYKLIQKDLYCQQTELSGLNSVHYKLNIFISKESNSSKELIATLNICLIEQKTTYCDCCGKTTEDIHHVQQNVKIKYRRNPDTRRHQEEARAKVKKCMQRYCSAWKKQLKTKSLRKMSLFSPLHKRS